MEENSTVVTVENPTIPKNFWIIMKRNIKACLNLGASSARRVSITMGTSQCTRRDIPRASRSEGKRRLQNMHDIHRFKTFSTHIFKKQFLLTILISFVRLLEKK